MFILNKHSFKTPYLSYFLFILLTYTSMRAHPKTPTNQKYSIAQEQLKGMATGDM